MNSVTGFLSRRLKLKVNEAKSAVARPETRKFLGFSFSHNKKPKRRISPKALLRCKQKIRELTRTDTRDQSGADDEGTCGLLKGLEELLRFLSDSFAAEGAGSLDTASTAIHDLEAMETRPSAVRKAMSTRGRYGSRRKNGG